MKCNRFIRLFAFHEKREEDYVRKDTNSRIR